ncbi:MAG: phosphonate ABC transporter, permease protein PhnE, partial [Pseudomonadota bacterium]
RDWPDTDETFVIRRDENELPYVVGYENRPESLPSTFRATRTKVEIRSDDLYERIQVFKTKVEVHRYEFGWKYFWFDFDSPLSGVGFVEAIGLMFDSDRVDPEQSNAALVLHEFLDNSMWLHGTVLYSLLETVFMALLGTMIACLFGLPLAFLAAKNIQPLSGVRFILRRLFDILRGIDVLIWSIIFLRAFGPGLFTGIFAIAFTDTGTLGKLMSEAIENSDNKQQEGVRSTGASKVQQHRYGILPQIMPVFISQSLYYLESNTRGAVIIGAMGAGGIGLQFLGALQTGTDWENVMYMALLVLLTVIFMDWMSARLRQALIGADRLK